MRDGISVTVIFQIVIIFILLFTGIMAMTINNANAFGVKDVIINAIEYNNGHINYTVNGDLGDDIVEPMQQASYRITGKCPDGFQGYDRNGRSTLSGDSAALCIRMVASTEGVNAYYNSHPDYSGKVGKGDTYCGYYYQIVVFYQLDIPIVNQVYNFSTKGETKIFYDRVNKSICPAVDNEHHYNETEH